MTATGTSARGPWRARPRTLRTRVTAVAGLALTAAVVLGLMIMYLVQRESARRTVDGELRTYATQLAQSVQGAGLWPRPLPPSTLDPNAQAQVLAADGSVLAATRSLQGLPAVYAEPAGSSAPVRQKAADGVIPSEVRVTALRISVAGSPVTIITVTSTGLSGQVNETFARLLLVGVPGILVLAAGTVWLVVGWALRPVEKIRHAVTEITAADLSRRVPEPGTGDEIGNLAQTMNDMLARLEDSALRQRRFVADASHELRSPLAAIRTTLEVGIVHPDRAPWPDIAQRAVRQSARLEDLVQQLLLLAKADDRQLAAQRRPVALGALLEEVRATTVTRHIDVEITATPDAVTIGNPEHLSRMFRNVLDNAIRHAEHRVLITAAATAETVRIEISDDGPGIPVEERERVFDRFVRLDASRQRASGSTGLGLAIAREIAAAHDGHIVITDALGGGARVVITLSPASDGLQENHRTVGADEAEGT
ncbi:sensor histidine kinase [Actinoallomurus rhizosphaericola]|uniref:sensor histidine kinase n=1 Tax=Actinoallomurus rhizosphaericola TaxID=2952536 RepID=UPI00209261A4|nr:ATP-binding protein [Actinoallomurus rhizosphaericola]MCO5995691.1 HAMP domain-containing histidine kinase [Actinoallomurus rhizosphaericola]